MLLRAAVNTLPTIMTVKEGVQMTRQEKCDSFLGSIKAATYICTVCGQIIWPTVTVNMDEVNIDSERCNVLGGLANRVLKRNVCKDCKKKMVL